MPIYILLQNSERKRLFQEFKKNSGLSLNKTPSCLKISRSMLFHYVSGKYPIPKSLFLRLKKIAEINELTFKEIEKQDYLQKKITFPQMNSQLAEILGALNGDGHISPLTNEVCIVGNLLEREYFEHLRSLFKGLFGLNFKIYVQPHSLRLRTYSKFLADYLNKTYGLPKGNKLGKLKIPLSLKSKKSLLIKYIRGLFDTDGSIYLRRKKDLAIEIRSADERYLREIKWALNFLGFKASLSGKGVKIQDQKMVHKFFKGVKPANSKHFKRYKMFSN